MDVLRLKARGRSPAASGTARGGELNRDGRGASPPAPSSSNGFGGVGGASGATGTPATLAAATTSTTTSSSNDVDFHHHHHQSSPPAKQLSSPAAMTTATTATATGNALPSTTLPASVQLVEFSYPSLLSPPNPAFVAGNETRGILMNARRPTSRDRNDVSPNSTTTNSLARSPSTNSHTSWHTYLWPHHPPSSATAAATTAANKENTLPAAFAAMLGVSMIPAAGGAAPAAPTPADSAAAAAALSPSPSSNSHASSSALSSSRPPVPRSSVSVDAHDRRAPSPHSYSSHAQQATTTTGTEPSGTSSTTATVTTRAKIRFAPLPDPRRPRRYSTGRDVWVDDDPDNIHLNTRDGNGARPEEWGTAIRGALGDRDSGNGSNSSGINNNTRRDDAFANDRPSSIFTPSSHGGRGGPATSIVSLPNSPTSAMSIPGSSAGSGHGQDEISGSSLGSVPTSTSSWHRRSNSTSAGSASYSGAGGNPSSLTTKLLNPLKFGRKANQNANSKQFTRTASMESSESSRTSSSWLPSFGSSGSISLGEPLSRHISEGALNGQTALEQRRAADFKSSGVPMRKSNTFESDRSNGSNAQQMPMRKAYPSVAQGANRRRGAYKGPSSTAAAIVEPEFMEWSNPTAGNSIGAVGKADADEDDGSGMAWLKRRRMERAKKEQDEREAAENAARQALLGADGEDTPQQQQQQQQQQGLTTRSGQHSATTSGTATPVLHHHHRAPLAFDKSADGDHHHHFGPDYDSQQQGSQSDVPTPTASRQNSMMPPLTTLPAASSTFAAMHQHQHDTEGSEADDIQLDEELEQGDRAEDHDRQGAVVGTARSNDKGEADEDAYEGDDDDDDGDNGDDDDEEEDDDDDDQDDEDDDLTPAELEAEERAQQQAIRKTTEGAGREKFHSHTHESATYQVDPTFNEIKAQ